GNVIGGGDWSADRILPDCVRAWNEKKPVVLRHPEFVRPWQHVLEPISGYLWLGHKLKAGDVPINGEAFNFGPKAIDSQSVASLVAQFQKYWPGANSQSVENIPGKLEAPSILLSYDKASQFLEWNPVLSFSQAVEMTGLWYKEFYSNPQRVSALTLEQIE